MIKRLCSYCYREARKRNDYAVLEWARGKDAEFALKFKNALAELRTYEWDGETRSLSAQSGRYKVGDYARAACKVLGIELQTND